MQLIDNIVKVNNSILQNNHLRMILLLVSGVFMGYTLQPVPKWLNNLFDTSNILKFLVLFVSGAIVVYPLTSENIMIVTLCSVIVLFLFQMARNYDKKLEDKKK